jgi:hypothetical protein
MWGDKEGVEKRRLRHAILVISVSGIRMLVGTGAATVSLGSLGTDDGMVVGTEAATVSLGDFGAET